MSIPPPDPIAPPKLDYQEISKSFDGSQVLEALDLSINGGEVFGLLGNSGTGKTILIKMAIGLLKPDSGRILLDGREITTLTEEELLPVRQRVSMLFQSNALFDSLTVLDNIAYPLREQTTSSDEEIRSRVSELLGWVLLPGIEDLLPSQLSGGMKKRVGLARAMATAPEVILFDEPTAGLDPVSTTVVNRMIQRVRDERGTTSIVITHDVKSALTISDRVAILADGGAVAIGTPEEVLACREPRVREFLQGYRLGEKYLAAS